MNKKLLILEILLHYVTNVKNMFSKTDYLSHCIFRYEGFMNLGNKRILIVDDDLEILELLKTILVRKGYMVVCTPNGGAMREAFQNWKIDLVILDVMLGFESGFDLCSELRKKNDVPLLLISAMSNDKFRLKGFDAGADDYIAKPFNPKLLLARVEAVLRRSRRSASLEYRQKNVNFEFAGWVLNSSAQELINDKNIQILLSNKEYKLLAALLANAPLALTREELAEHLLTDTSVDNNEKFAANLSRAIDVQIGRIRQKIETDVKLPKHIKTLRGEGYFFASNVKRLE